MSRLKLDRFDRTERTGTLLAALWFVGTFSALAEHGVPRALLLAILPPLLAWALLRRIRHTPRA